MNNSNSIKLDRAILFSITALVITTLACQLNLGGPDIPFLDSGPSEEDAQALLDEWQSAFGQAETGDGRVQLTITEQQLTALIRQQLEQQQDPIIRQASVRLQDDLIRISGTAQQNLIRAEILVEVQVDVSADGEPTFEIISAEFGPVPLPDPVKDGIEALVAEAFAGSVGPYLTGFELETITIADGEMTLIGELR